MFPKMKRFGRRAGIWARIEGGARGGNGPAVGISSARKNLEAAKAQLPEGLKTAAGVHRTPAAISAATFLFRTVFPLRWGDI